MFQGISTAHKALIQVSSEDQNQDRGSSSCRRAVQALRSVRSVRSHFHPEDRVNDEQRSNFAPYSRRTSAKRKNTYSKPPTSKKQKPQPWTVKMVCLGGKNDKVVPTSPTSKLALVRAGLCEIKNVVEDVQCAEAEFITFCYCHLPKA